MRRHLCRVAPACTLATSLALPCAAQAPAAPPPYAYPQGYRPPAPAPPPQGDRPAIITPWDPDDPPPDGYLLRSKVNGGAIGAGAAVLGVTWLTSIFAGAVLGSEEDERGIDGDGVESPDWAPMYVPIAGPFATIHTVEPSSAGLGWLLADGILQVGGAALIVYGIADRDYRLVKSPVAEWRITPVVTGATNGVALEGAF